MARINIEDSLFKNMGFMTIVAETGNPDAALGAVVRAFMLAQKYWFPDQKRIPREAWERELLPESIIKGGLAVEDQNGIYMRGSKEQFAWLFQKSDAGKASAESKKTKKGQRKSTSVERTSTSVERPSTSSSSSSSSSFSFSDSSTDSNSISENNSVGSVRSPAAYFIGCYVKAYQKRYGEKARPDLRGKVQGLIKLFLNETPIERACAMIEVYLSMGDAWFLTKAHDFVTFSENVSKIGLKLDTGKSANSTQARSEEKLDATKDQMRRVMEGNL